MGVDTQTIFDLANVRKTSKSKDDKEKSKNDTDKNEHFA